MYQFVPNDCTNHGNRDFNRNLSISIYIYRKSVSCVVHPPLKKKVFHEFCSIFIIVIKKKRRKMSRQASRLDAKKVVS